MYQVVVFKTRQPAGESCVSLRTFACAVGGRA